jgi:hypothetical protein
MLNSNGHSEARILHQIGATITYRVALNQVTDQLITFAIVKA